MKRWTFILAAGLALASCATEMTRRYAGQPVQVLFPDYGEPDAIYDLEDGRRAFEWINPDGDVDLEGGTSPELWTTDEPTGEDEYRFDYCRPAVFARWDAARNAWIIETARAGVAPRGGHCGMSRGR